MSNTVLADTVLDFFDSGVGPLVGPYGGTEFPANYPVPVSLDYAIDGDSNTSVSLPTGSYITVAFSNGGIVNGPGNDLFISEPGSGLEVADIYVSSDSGLTFTYLGEAYGDQLTELDLDDIGYFGLVNAVRVVGLDNGGDSPGFDIAFVTATENSSISKDVPGSEDNDEITGSDDNEYFDLGSGDDFLSAGDGNDYIFAGNGNDAVWAGAGDAGNDTAFGGAGDDTIGGGAGADSLSGEEDDDLLFGGSEGDVLLCGEGDDIAWAGEGDDSVAGDAGSDIFGGGLGNDILLGGTGNDIIYSSSGNDEVSGDVGNDLLFGGDGYDTLTGGAGDDSLFGGNDDDLFIFEANHGNDYIGGFVTKGDNTIDLSALSLSGFGALGILQSGADVVIDTGEGTITLWTAGTSDVTAGDFIF